MQEYLPGLMLGLAGTVMAVGYLAKRRAHNKTISEQPEAHVAIDVVSLQANDGCKESVVWKDQTMIAKGSKATVYLDPWTDLESKRYRRRFMRLLDTPEREFSLEVEFDLDNFSFNGKLISVTASNGKIYRGEELDEIREGFTLRVNKIKAI